MSTPGILSTILEASASWLVTIHCIAPHLELAVKDCFKNKYYDTVVIETLTSIYLFYKNSTKRLCELKDVALWMEKHVSKPSRANGTRWVSHKVEAVAKMI